MCFFIQIITLGGFILGLVIGLVLGVNISLFLYAIILVAKDADESIERYTLNNQQKGCVLNDYYKFIIKQ